MPIEGVDYAWERPSPSGLYAAGKRFACRYLSYNTTGKNLTATERDALWAAGLAIVLNWENRADDVHDGYAGGVRNARAALAQANALGVSDLPIYFSIDEDTRGNPAIIDAYLKGIGSVLPVSRIGVYGGLSTIQRAHDQRLASWYWQTYAWSGGVWAAYAHLQQYRNGVTVAGADTDLNRAMVSGYGQWTGDEVNLSDSLKAYGGLDITVGGALATLLVRTDYLANKVGLVTRLDAILKAASADPAVPVALTPDQVAALAQHVAEQLHVPTADEVVDELHARLES